MINISTFHVAQKSMWIRIAADNSGKWGHLFQAVCGMNKEILYRILFSEFVTLIEDKLNSEYH